MNRSRRFPAARVRNSRAGIRHRGKNPHQHRLQFAKMIGYRHTDICAQIGSGTHSHRRKLSRFPRTYACRKEAVFIPAVQGTGPHMGPGPEQRTHQGYHLQAPEQAGTAQDPGYRALLRQRALHQEKRRVRTKDRPQRNRPFPSPQNRREGNIPESGSKSGEKIRNDRGTELFDRFLSPRTSVRMRVG